MNTIQLKRIAGEPWTLQEYGALEVLAFSCPLEAGNAVYRARSILRTQGDYVFDDVALCGLDQESILKRKTTEIENPVPGPKSEWQIYPNPARHQLWIAGSQMEDLQSVQLFDGLGRLMFEQQNKGAARLALHLPAHMQEGIYFLRLQLHNGDTETRKILLQP